MPDAAPEPTPLSLPFSLDGGEWNAADAQALAGEAIGWQPLEPGAYFHLGAPASHTWVVDVVGIPDASQAGLNVLLLT